jgi:fluoroacetyl-CoA thioesterase
MPKVLATGFLVGLIEVTCAQALTKHLEEGEGSLGIHVNLSHTSPTPPGMTVEVRSKVIEVDGNKITFEVVAKDEMDVISEGTHRRFVVNWDRFQSKIDGKKKG